jgi:NAD(P)-dependent dehydrogenase (short-subunit alcohol dehydrogenase family)
MKKAVLITGAGSGIGKATALEFASLGYFVYLVGRNKEKLEETASLCRAGARRYGCDLTDQSQIDKTTNDILSQKDTDLQILVNNAGIFQRHDFSEGGIKVWQQQFATNLFGAVAITQNIYPHFKKRGGGSILNVASTLGLKPSPSVSAYSASKAAMISWTQTLALEAGAFKIRVNCVCPGIVDTPIHSFHEMPTDKKGSVLKNLNPLQPLGTIGQPEQIAKAIAFLAGESSPWTTGAVLAVDGGINLT